MSNEFVMVPRAELVRLQESMDPHRGAVAWGIVCDLLAKPVMRQGEPVAWRYQTHTGGLWYLSSSEHNARMFESTEKGSCVEPLYTHADPGEVERLIAQCLERDARIAEMDRIGSARIQELQAKLAARSVSVERDDRADFEKAVIDKAERFQPDLRRYGEHPDAEYRDANLEWAWGLWQARAALSASAEPSAPVECDERAKFESAYPGLVGRVRWDEAKQEYRSGSKGLGWQEGLKATEWLAVWRARAALERKPS